LRVLEEKIEHIDVARHLIFVSIQLSSPVKDLDWEFDTERQAWTWRSNPRNKRINEVQRTLDFLFSDASPKVPDVIVFPEYTIPKEAHSKINFKKLASENSCIIIPGSYFEDSEADPKRFRNNVCHIYLPNSKVVTIGKIHAAPDEDGLAPARDLPNIARFVWEPPGLKPLSISVFLCRDYLTPFSEDGSGHPDDANIETNQNVSLLDWNREGINIVVMNNSRSQLFESAAAFDVREVHGQRKAVLLTNCASDDSDLGTALLVASPTRERADIAASIPPKITGVLFAEVRLWDMVFKRGGPDYKKSFPVKYVGLYSIDFANPIAIKPITAEKPAPLGRGIWHPAFLEELRKIIVLDFFVAQSTLVTVANAFADGQIQHVKAGFVHGIHDVMIRRYAPRYLQRSGRVPLSLPFSHLLDNELRDIFAIGRGFPELQVIIHPEKLLKYRGAQVPNGDDWNRAHEAIKNIVVTADINELIKRSCAIANEIEPSGDNNEKFEIPPDLKQIFSLDVEPYMPIGPQYGNKKEYYVLIRAQRSEKDETPSERFRQQVILGTLMSDPNVREISEVESKPQKFHYAIQLETSSYDLDDIVFRMHEWAHDNNIAFGTRTYELWRYLSRDSIAGIERTTMEEFERDFLAEAKQLAVDIRSLILTNDQRRKIASAWQSARFTMAQFGSCRRHVGEFYLFLTLYNFQKTSAESDYFQGCETAWLQMVRHMERMAEDLLIEALSLKPVGGSGKPTREDIAKEIERKIENKISKNTEWKEIKKYPVRIAAQYFDDLVGSKDHLIRFRRHLSEIFGKRNWVAHSDHDLFEEFINLRGQDWPEKLKKVELATTQVSEALMDIDQEMKSLKR
jgi:hypothetical protein